MFYSLPLWRYRVFAHYKYRKIDVACPASQLICAWMMSFEDHLLLLALPVFFFLST